MMPTLGSLSAYVVCVWLAIAVGVAVTLAAARRLSVPWSRLFAVEAIVVAAGAVGARAVGMLEQDLPWSAATDLSTLRLRYPGGIVAILLALPIATRLAGIPLRSFADVVAVGACAAMGTVRIGCLLAGCCYGTPTSLPFGVAFPARSGAWLAHVDRGLISEGSLHSLPVHPLQVYLGLWAMTVLAILLGMLRRRVPPGSVFVSFLILHETGKLVLEGLRDPINPPLRYVSASIAACAVASAVAWYAASRRNAPLAVTYSFGEKPRETRF